MKVFELNALSRVIFSTGMDGISCYVLLTGEDGELVELDEKTVGWIRYNFLWLWLWLWLWLS